VSGEVANIVIAGLVGLLTVVIVPLIGFLLAHRWKATDAKVDRIEHKLDTIPTEFAKTHARISDVQQDVARIEARVEAHIDESRHGREGRRP
jgi:hypothetical protein